MTEMIIVYYFVMAINNILKPKEIFCGLILPKFVLQIS